MFHLAHNCLDTNCLNGVSFPVLSVFVDFCGFKSNELAANTNKIIEIQTDQNEKKRRKKNTAEIILTAKIKCTNFK